MLDEKGSAKIPDFGLAQTITSTKFTRMGPRLGTVAFVFEGRPNVLADACGVLRSGNTVVFRIGGDALRTARAIMNPSPHGAGAVDAMKPGIEAGVWPPV